MIRRSIPEPTIIRLVLDNHVVSHETSLNQVLGSQIKSSKKNLRWTNDKGDIPSSIYITPQPGKYASPISQ